MSPPSDGKRSRLPRCSRCNRHVVTRALTVMLDGTTLCQNCFNRLPKARRKRAAT